MSRWPHSPLHVFNAKGSYIVTAGTVYKQHFFKRPSDLDLLQNSLFELALMYGWSLEAWAIFPNHYHFIAHSSKDSITLRQLVTHLHSKTARILNKQENTPGRQVWFQYWDTQLTFEKSYLARLNYVMNNPVKHGIVSNAAEYKWCSKSWFDCNANPAYRKVVDGFKVDTIQVKDYF